ncbi:MAG: TetR/AcrR family transcriptional regulator [Chloroflexi bacterium]|nr:TetR/AcrR family transcriptional regulator [Chloroflexota bacterium]
MSDEFDRHAQRKAATHQKILDATQDLIAQRGYVQVDISDITECANVSRGTFYQHFANKEACVRELVQQGFESLLQEILENRHETESVEIWGRDSLTRVFTWTRENQELLQVILGGAASPELNIFGRSYMADIIEQNLHHAENWAESQLPITIRAQVITGTLIQLLNWWLETDNDYSAEQMAHMIHLVFTSGLAPDIPQS